MYRVSGLSSAGKGGGQWEAKHGFSQYSAAPIPWPPSRRPRTLHAPLLHPIRVRGAPGRFISELCLFSEVYWENTALFLPGRKESYYTGVYPQGSATQQCNSPGGCASGRTAARSAKPRKSRIARGLPCLCLRWRGPLLLPADAAHSPLQVTLRVRGRPRAGSRRRRPAM